MHQPTARVLSILDAIMKDPNGRSLADFHKELGIPKSTLLPILQTLCGSRYLSQNSAGMYVPGSALFSLGSAFSGNYPILEFVRAQLEQMSAQLGETYYFGVLEDGCVLYLDKVESTEPLRMLISTGRRLPAYGTGIGKALLIDKTREELTALYTDTLAPLTKNTLPDTAALFCQLQEANAVGYASETEESMEHVRCFAAPVRKRGRIIAAVSVAIPTFRYKEELREDTVSMLKDTADRIGRRAEETDAHFGNFF